MKFLPELHGLTPASARLCLDVERFWLRDLRMPRGLRLLLALSGGADSTALAVILRILSPRLELDLYALTVNHGLRAGSRRRRPLDAAPLRTSEDRLRSA